MAKIQKDSWVSVGYEGKLKDGTVFDKGEDFVFQVGAGKVIKGFDASVQEMEVGEEKEFTIPCADAYGEETDNQKEKVPKDFFNSVEKVEIGMNFVAQTPMGPLKVKVLTEEPDGYMVSLNHPLAGEDLTFKLKVDKVLTEEEVKAKEEEDKKKMEEFMKAQQEAMKQASEHACGPDCNSYGAACDCEHKKE